MDQHPVVCSGYSSFGVTTQGSGTSNKAHLVTGRALCTHIAARNRGSSAPQYLVVHHSSIQNIGVAAPRHRRVRAIQILFAFPPPGNDGVGANRRHDGETHLNRIAGCAPEGTANTRVGERVQKNGFGEQFQVRYRALQSLGWAQAPAISQELPPYEQFAHCFRRGAYIPFSDLLKVVLGPVGGNRARDGRSARPGLLGATAEPWSNRLRLRLRAKAPLPAAAEGTGRTTAPEQLEASPETVTERGSHVRPFVRDTPLTTVRPFLPRKRSAN